MDNNPKHRGSESPDDEGRGHLGKWIISAAGLWWVGKTVRRWLKAGGSAQAAPAPSFAGQPQRGHETRDANAKWIFGIVVGLFVFGLSIHFILAALLSSLKHTAPPTDAWRPVKAATARQKPAAPFPRLQVSPPMDLQSFRAAEDTELNTYGWINRTSGVVRLPVERAMDLLLKQGFPARSSAGENKAGPSPYQLIQQRPNQREY